MNTKDNQQARKTQEKIKAILLARMASQPFHQITVQEICREARINRTTFYTHFDNLSDLMQTIELEMQQGVSRLFLDEASGAYKPLTETSLEKLIGYIYKNAAFYRILLNDFNSLELLDRDLAAAWEKEIEPAFRKKGDATDAQIHYRYEYFNSGFRGIIRRWLNEGCPETPGELTRVIRNVVQV